MYKRQGNGCALLSSIEYYDGKTREASTLTTPESLELCRHCLLYTSKQLAVGNLTGFLSYVMQVMNSMMMIANVFLLLTRSMAVSYTHLNCHLE